MKKKVRVVAFVIFCAILVIYGVYKSHVLQAQCQQRSYFYNYR